MKKIVKMIATLMALMVIFFTGAMVKAEPIDDPPVEVDKTQLQVAIDEANAILDKEEPETPYYPELLLARDHAQAIMDNAEATEEEVAEQTSLLTEAIAEYKKQNPDPVIEEKEEVREEAIPFETETIEDDTLMAGEKVIDQEGEEGTLTITEKVTYTNGVETAREEISREVTKKPVKKIVRVGTMVVEVKTETKEQTIPFEVVTIEDNTLMAGTQVVENQGQAGTIKITEEVTYTNGVETARKEISREVVTPKVDKVIRVGTKVLDKAPLQEAINYVNGINLSRYSERTVANLKEALAVANSLMNRTDIMQADLDQAYNNLRSAVQGLKAYGVGLELLPDLTRVAKGTNLNVVAVVTNVGNVDLSNVVINNGQGKALNIGSIAAGEKKLFNLSYVVPENFDANDYSVYVSINGTYTDQTTVRNEQAVSLPVVAEEKETIEKERQPDVKDKAQDMEVADKLDLPATGETAVAMFAVPMLLIALVALVVRKKQTSK